jgi:hypothetical protein
MDLSFARCIGANHARIRSIRQQHAAYAGRMPRDAIVNCV